MKEQPTYAAPAIVAEGKLEIQAGSPALIPGDPYSDPDRGLDLGIGLGFGEDPGLSIGGESDF